MNFGLSRDRVLILAVLLVSLIIIVRLFYLQVIDSQYKAVADSNALRYQVQFPPRGEVYDRNGEFLVQSKESYDLVVIPRDVEQFDTALTPLIITAYLSATRSIHPQRRLRPVTEPNSCPI